jgi:hypothetical protein
VFKSAEEVKRIDALLSSVDDKSFRKKADIKKLLKAGWLEAYDKKSIINDADYMISLLADEFSALRGVYQKAAGQGKGMLVYAGFEGEDE